MKKTLLFASEWSKIHTVTNEAKPEEKIVEIDITGIIGDSGGWFSDDNEASKNTKDKMRAELKAIAELNATLIIINIDSPGGSVAHGLSIHDMLAAHPAKKETRIIGMTASIATIIAQVGDTRKMSENALMLVHHASWGLMGGFNAQELEGVIADLKTVDTRLQAIYEKKTGKKAAAVKELMDANAGQGKWIDAEEAKGFNLIDEIFEPASAKMAAQVDPEIIAKFKYPNLPTNMTKTATDTRSLFDKIKAGILAIFAASDVENKDVPEEIQNQIQEFNTKLTALEAENARMEEAATATATEIENLTNQVAAGATTLAERDQTITDLNARIASQETLINQLRANSTKVKGVAGGEDNNPTPKTKEELAWEESLENLRKGQQPRRDDVEPDPIK